MAASLHSMAQLPKWAKQSASAVSFFSSGFFFRRAEIRKDDYRRYAAVHPNADPQFANPRLSFRNKYQDWPTNQEPAYFLSTSLLVFTTDGFHMDNAIAGASMATGLGFSLSLGTKPKFWPIIKQVAISWASYTTGRFVADKVYPKID